MHCPHPPSIAVRNVVTPISTPNVLQKVNSAMHVVATITSLHCASREANNRQLSRPHEEVINLNAVIAVLEELHTMPATPHIGTATEAPAIITLPGPHPTVPHIVLPIAHCPGTLLDKIGAPHPIGTIRMLLR